MKNNLFAKCLTGLFAMAALYGCNTETEQFHYLRLSQVACTFKSADNLPLTIGVEASPAVWKAESGATWVKTERSDDGLSLTVSVEDNASAAERTTEIMLTAGEASQRIFIRQLGADDAAPYIYRKLPSFLNGAVLSTNGQYIGGIENEVTDGNDLNYYAVIIDMATGERLRHGPYPSAIHTFSEPWAITDYGTLFVSDNVHGGTWAIDLEGNIFQPEAPDGFTTKPSVQGVTPDGNRWVGYIKQSGGLYHPVVWKEGEPELLPMPDKNFRGFDFINGVMARGISANGEIIYGTTWDDTEFGMVYWKDGQVAYVGKDLHKPIRLEVEEPNSGETIVYHIANGFTSYAEICKVSPSGNWIAGIYQEWTVTDDVVSSYCTKYPAFYNTETETSIVVTDYGPDATGKHATDDGIAFIATGGTFFPTTGRVYDLNTETDLGTTEQWVYDNYGIIIPAGYVEYITPDKSTVIGRVLYEAAAVRARLINWYLAPRPSRER